MPAVNQILGSITTARNALPCPQAHHCEDCDKVIWLEKGRIKMIGKSEKVLKVYNQSTEGALKKQLKTDIFYSLFDEMNAK